MIHRLFPTVGDVVAAIGWFALVTSVAVGTALEVRAQRRRERARTPVGDRYARHRPRW